MIMKPADSTEATKKNIEVLNRVIFGDTETGDIGMQQKVDEMHKLLMQARNVGGFFGSVGGTLKWLLVIAAVIVVIKGWFSELIHLIVVNAKF